MAQVAGAGKRAARAGATFLGMDDRLRELERLARSGDADARARLDRERQRLGRPSAAAERLLAFVGAPDGRPLATRDLPEGWDVAHVYGRARRIAAEVREEHATASAFMLAYTCRFATPAAARGLLALLDELGVAPEHPARFELVGRLVLGLREWGLEAFVRGALAALRRACDAPSPRLGAAFAAVARWLDDPGHETAQAAIDAGAALRPDFSAYYNFAPTGNTDALDEAVAEWERGQPVDAGLVELSRSLAFDRGHEDAALALSRLRHVDARDLEAAVRDAMWAWATAPGARLADA